MFRHNLGIGINTLSTGGGGGYAAQLLSGYSTGFAFSARDMSVLVRGHTANFSGNANDFFDYTDPSEKWVYNQAGVLYASSGQLPRDYDPSTGAVRGLLVETEFTNYAGYASEDFSAWNVDNSGATNPVVTANYGLAPTGEQTADRIVFDKTGGVFSRILKAISATAGSPAIFTVWKRTTGAGPSNVGMGIGSAGFVNRVVTSEMQRFWMTVADGGASPSPQILLFDSIAGNDETADIVAWGANIGIGSFPTSYVPCTVSPTDVIRNADDISKAISAIPWAAGGNIVTISGYTALGIGSGPQVLFQADDGTEDNRVRIERNTSREIHCIVSVGGVDQCDLDLGVVADDTSFSVSFGSAEDDFSASLNGNTPEADAGGTLPTVNVFRLGSSSSGEQFCAGPLDLSVVPAA